MLLMAVLTFIVKLPRNKERNFKKSKSNLIFNSWFSLTNLAFIRACIAPMRDPALAREQLWQKLLKSTPRDQWSAHFLWQGSVLHLPSKVRSMAKSFNNMCNTFFANSFGAAISSSWTTLNFTIIARPSEWLKARAHGLCICRRIVQISIQSKNVFRRSKRS